MRPDARSRLFAAALLLPLMLPAAPPPAAADEFRPLPLNTRPIGSFGIGSSERIFGEFEFLGGLVLTSRDRDFGGLSGIDFLADGRLLAISDMGLWIAARPERENGRLVGLSDAMIAPIRDSRGLALSSKRDADAEGLRVANGTAYVSFERRHAIAAYPAKDVARAKARPIGIPKALGKLRSNSGLESIAAAPPGGPLRGALVVVAERSLDQAGNHKAAVLSGPRAGTFRIRRTDDYNVTDAAFLPNGDLLILERKVPSKISVAIRIRRLSGDIQPGAVLDGPVVLEADMRDQIDNMEGLAVSRAEDGATRITLVSDDNKNLFQRTLLLEFAWRGGPPVEAPAEEDDRSALKAPLPKPKPPA